MPISRAADGFKMLYIVRNQNQCKPSTSKAEIEESVIIQTESSEEWKKHNRTSM